MKLNRKHIDRKNEVGRLLQDKRREYTHKLNKPERDWDSPAERSLTLARMRQEIHTLEDEQAKL